MYIREYDLHEKGVINSVEHDKLQVAMNVAADLPAA